MPWQFAIGNAVARAASDPVASLSSAEDSLFPLSALGNGLTDEPARWARNTSALYGADIDLNLLAHTSPRADAPTGFYDFLNLVEGTPGLPTDAPDWGTYASRTALRLFRPVAQDVEVMPGETVTMKVGLYLPSASSATAVRLRVLDLWTGKSWDGSLNQWTDGDVEVVEQVATDAWVDVTETITADPDRRERGRYRVLVQNDAGTYDSSSYVYASDLALYPNVDFAAIVGHNIPRGATVTVQDSGAAGSAISLTPEVPSFFGTQTAQAYQTWRLTIDLATGSEGHAERPYIGELWLGSLSTMTWCPAYPFELTIEDLGQTRVAGGYGREYVFSDAPRELAAIKMNFKVNGDDGYEQIRDALQNATRHGVDPMMLLPIDILEGAICYHGRLGNKVVYKRRNYTRREFALTFDETPFPRVAA